MDKKLKKNRKRIPTREELEDATPPGASFDTEAGRAAQGMRPDIGRHDDSSPVEADERTLDEKQDAAVD